MLHQTKFDLSLYDNVLYLRNMLGIGDDQICGFANLNKASIG